jgi:hypothetical protein
MVDGQQQQYAETLSPHIHRLTPLRSVMCPAQYTLDHVLLRTWIPDYDN